MTESVGWGPAVDAFSAYLADTDRAPATCDGYVKHLGWLAESAPAGPWDLTAPQLAAWLDAPNWSKDTRRKVLVSLRTFYAWAVAEGLCEWAPTAGVASRAGRRPGPKPDRFPPAWAAVIDGYIAHLRAGGRSEGTIGQYLVRLRVLAGVSSSPWAVTGQQLAEWLSQPDWSPNTKRCSRVAVSSFYRWALRAGHTDVSPAADLDPVRVPRALPRPAPDDALRAALAYADDRTRLAVKLAAYAGLRRSEIASLHTRQIGETELLVVGKGGHHRRVPLHPDLAGELHAELARRRDGRCGTGWSGAFVSAGGYLFPSSHHPGPITAHHLSKTIAAVLPGDWTTHTLRHRFATAAYEVERDLRAVQELLGHTKPETTALYAAVPEGALRSSVAGIAVV